MPCAAPRAHHSATIATNTAARVTALSEACSETACSPWDDQANARRRWPEYSFNLIVGEPGLALGFLAAKSAGDEFLEQVAGGVASDPDGGVLEDDPGGVAVGRWDVQVGEGA
jgi:hypothetical protein